MVTESDVTFHLRTRNADVEVQITDENFSNVISDRKFYFVIHGWLSSHSEQWVKNLTNVYLKQDDCNVIQVDWRAPADQLEYISSRNTEGVGKIFSVISEYTHNPFGPPQVISWDNS